MKKYFFGIFTASLLLISCVKSTGDKYRFSSYTVVNAAINIANAKVYTAEYDIPWRILPATDAVAFGRSFIFGTWVGGNYIRAVSAADTNLVIYNSSKAEEFEDGSFNTLFLCGDAGTYGGLFLQNEDIPNQDDNSVGIRFLNLSPNSTPVIVTLANTPTLNETTGLSYKQITGFKIYPADQSVTQYDFQIRNAATNAVLSTYSLKQTTATSPYTSVSLALARKKNITVVIKGLQGTTSGTNSLGVFPVPHY